MKAPTWLRESYRDGVDERYASGPFGVCWLAQFDPLRRPCSGRGERFHFIPRKRCRGALFALLEPERDLLDLIEWDDRNGGIACEGHHRRFDHHLTPSLIVARPALPGHVHEFAADWGIGFLIEDRFPMHVDEEQPIR